MNGNNSETWWKVLSNCETKTPLSSQDLLQAVTNSNRATSKAQKMSRVVRRVMIAKPCEILVNEIFYIDTGVLVFKLSGSGPLIAQTDWTNSCPLSLTV